MQSKQSISIEIPVEDILTSAKYRLIEPTGSHDEVAINKAINELNPAKSGGFGVGGTVYLLPGTYDISAPIELAPNINLIGAGHTATVLNVSKKIDAIRMPLTDAADGSVTIKGFWLFGTTDFSVLPIYSSTISRAYDNVIVDNTLDFYDGALSNTAVEIYTWDERAQVIPIVANSGAYITLAYAPRVIPKAGTGYHIISNGIALYGNMGTHSFIDDVYMMRICGCGIVIGNASQTIISNCYIAGNRSDAIRISPRQYGTGGPNIVNCVLNGSYGSAIRNDGDLFYMRVTNNMLFGSKVLSAAIKGYNLQRSIIANNVVPVAATITIDVTGTVYSCTPNSITLVEAIPWKDYAYIGEVITVENRCSRLITNSSRDADNRVVITFEHEAMSNVKAGDKVVIHRWPRGGFILEGASKDNIISCNILQDDEPYNIEPIYLGSKTNNNKVLDNFAKVLNFSKTNVIR